MYRKNIKDVLNVDSKGLYDKTTTLHEGSKTSTMANSSVIKGPFRFKTSVSLLKSRYYKMD